VQRGIVAFASASRIEDSGFESRQGVRFLGLYALHCCYQKLACIVIVYMYWRKINASNEKNVLHTFPTVLSMYIHIHLTRRHCGQGFSMHFVGLAQTVIACFQPAAQT
jgi:hypothetical protein